MTSYSILSTSLVEITDLEDPRADPDPTTAASSSLAITVALSLVLAACGSSSKSGSTPSGSSSASSSGPSRCASATSRTSRTRPRSSASQSGSFAAKLGPNVKLELKTFNSGTEATTALLAGAIDASFVGPNPAINAYQKTNGGIRIVVRHRVGRRRTSS